MGLFIRISLERLALTSSILHCLVPIVGHIGVKAAAPWGWPCHLYFPDSSWQGDLTLLTSM